MEDLVASVLRAAAEKESSFKTIEVEKAIDLDIDEGNLLACDVNPLDLKQFKANREEYLKALARDNTQLLLNSLWKLPSSNVDGSFIVDLPDSKTWIPREKPIPKEKANTTWQNFAKLKGIVKKKRGRMLYDDESKTYKPRWGYERANDPTKAWVLEVPDNADPFEDQFNKVSKAKNERVAKNELHRLRNIARAQTPKTPGVGLMPTQTPDKDYVTKALSVAKTSTASIGRFTETLKEEKPTKHGGKKRKFESNFGDVKKETTNQMDILDRILNKQPKLDITKATNKHIHEEERTRHEEKEAEGDGGWKKGGKKRFQQPKNNFGKPSDMKFKGAGKAGGKGGKKTFKKGGQSRRGRKR